MLGASVNAKREVYNVNRVIKPYVMERTIATGLDLAQALRLSKTLTLSSGIPHKARLVNLPAVLPVNWIQVNGARTVNRPLIIARPIEAVVKQSKARKDKAKRKAK